MNSWHQTLDIQIPPEALCFRNIFGSKWHLLSFGVWMSKELCFFLPHQRQLDHQSQLQSNGWCSVAGSLMGWHIIWLWPKKPWKSSPPNKSWLVFGMICLKDSLLLLDLLEIFKMLGKSSKHILPNSGLMVIYLMVQSVKHHLKQIPVSKGFLMLPMGKV